MIAQAVMLVNAISSNVDAFLLDYIYWPITDIILFYPLSNNQYYIILSIEQSLFLYYFIN